MSLFYCFSFLFVLLGLNCFHVIYATRITAKDTSHESYIPRNVKQGRNTGTLLGYTAEDAVVRRMAQLIILLKKPGAQRQLLCSATVLSKNWLLTPAHCLRPYDGSNFKVSLQDSYAFIGESDATLRAGNTNIRPYGFKIYLIHKSYNPSNAVAGGDIALLELQRPIDTAKFSKVDLPFTSSIDLGPNDTFIIAGYGGAKFVNNRTVPIPNNLQEGPQDVKLFSECTAIAIEAYRPFLDEYKLLCAEPSAKVLDGRKASCFATSGAPMFLRKANGGSALQIGVLSFASNNVCGEGVSWFTRLSTYRADILNALSNNFFQWEIGYF